MLENKLEELCKDLPLTRAIGLASKVKIEDEEKHIPMIDFGCDYRHLNAALNSNFNGKIKMPGMIVASGNSFHFYGFELLNQNKWVEFMELIKNIPEVDKNWPDLQLKQGFSMLRITPSRRKLTQPCFLDYHNLKLVEGNSSHKATKVKQVA